ncbi:MAG: S-layer homology domain-containing protein, partial [Oscillospiraceae bacterium]|nr:S-layer homology domain-containing protein [Oscillospiraceae bacterium]
LTTTVNNPIDGKTHWEATSTPGYEIVTDESSLSSWRKFTTWPDGIDRLHIATSATGGFWPESDVSGKKVTIAVDFPVAGWYSAYLTGGQTYAGGQFSVFGNGSYLGDYNFYYPTQDAAKDGKAGPEKRLNTAYYKAGKNKITFCVRGTNYSTPYLLLQSLSFVPESKEPVASHIESTPEVPQNLVVGEKYDIEAAIKMTDESDFHIGVNADGSLDTANTLTVSSDNADVIEISDIKGYEPGSSGKLTYKITAKNTGKANLTLSALVRGNPVEKIVPIEVTNEDIGSTEITGVPDEMYIGQRVTPGAKNMLEGGRVLGDGIAENVYSSENPDVADVEDGVLVAKSSGLAVIKVATTFLGKTVYGSKTIKVADEVIKDIEITAGGSEHIRLTDDPNDTVPLYITATTNKGREVDLSGSKITYTAHNPERADIDENGTIYPKAEGEAEFSVSFEFNKSKWSAKKTLTVARGKARFTLYTEEEREAARENGKKYDWAEKIVEKTTTKADAYVDQLDKLYDMIPSEGIPRAFVIAVKGDPEAYICKYCGKNLRQDYGNYSYRIDSLTRPWKIQCPDCKRLFPSNDFEKLYKLGLNEYGEYSAERAREKNQELIDSGFFANHKSEAVRKYGYLGNELYPEVGTDPECPVKLNPGEDPLGWGADDGLGYVTGKVLDNGIPERYNFIAYYLHWGLFRSASGGFSVGQVYIAIRETALAYVYTGDKKYGRVAAVLLDRLADFYPGYDLSIYGENIQNSDGGTMKGKTIGRIWETGALGTYIQSYDAVFDMYDDPEVLAYIRSKAETIKMRHAKNTPSQIRTNIEDGLIREGLEAIRRNQVSGNFGYPQVPNAYGAVVLDSMPETKYWLDYLMAPGFTNKGDYSPGGGILDQLVNQVDHDGEGNEASDYNTDWMVTLLGIQDALDDYDPDAFANASLYNNPKFVRMFYPYAPMVMASYTPEIGDSQSTAERSFWLETENAIKGYRKLRDERTKKTLAQYIYMRNGNTTDGLNEGIFVKNPEGIQEEIKKIIEEKGTLNPPAEMLTGFGFAALRDGVEFSDVTSPTQFDNRHGFWMYFGYNGGHGHRDSLNLGMDAFGLNFMPELGYPEETQKQPNRLQWVSNTLAHNTVTVDGDWQKTSDVRGKSLHFDDSEMVQLMDVDAKSVYPQTDIYRRSVVMVKIDDNSFYGVDFFRVKGGDDHLYSLHALSNEICDTEGLDLVSQTDENGNYKGTYAGIDAKYIKNEKTGKVRAYTENAVLAENEVVLEAEFGADPNSPDAWEYDTIFPRGYTWLENVDRDNSQSEQFEVDFKIKDFKKALGGKAGDLHLRATMLSVGEGTTVSTADGYPPQKAENKAIPSLRYLLVNRTGENLDTMFTTVLEPYRDTRTLGGAQELALSIKEGTETARDTHRAVKVTHKDGTVDYVFYATSNEVTYTVEDNGQTIDFRGFVGVYRVKNGVNIYKYVCDGDIIGENTEKTVSIKGRVSGFTEDLAFENEIRMKPSAAVDEEILSELANRYVFIENNGQRNGSYKIESAKLDTETGELVLDIGTATLIRKYKVADDLNGGFVYNIDRRNDCVIPLSFEEASLPTFGAYTDGTVSAGSRYEQVITAQDANGGKATVTGEDLPRGASFNSDTNTFTWKPDSSQIGDNHVSLTATDEYGRKATIHFVVTVYGSTTGSSGQGTTDTTPDSSATENTGSAGGGGGGGGGGGAAPTDKSDDETNTGKTDTSDEKDKDESLLLEEKVPSGDEADEVENNEPEASGETDVIRFTDLGNHAWAADAINTLADDGIIRGTTSDTYSPGHNITRADFASLLVRAFELKSDNTENFADVSASDYFAAELAVAR